jgi:hypothetical protein
MAIQSNKGMTSCGLRDRLGLEVRIEQHLPLKQRAQDIEQAIGEAA